jgi:hypothetical protein
MAVSQKFCPILQKLDLRFDKKTLPQILEAATHHEGVFLSRLKPWYRITNHIQDQM